MGVDQGDLVGVLLLDDGESDPLELDGPVVLVEDGPLDETVPDASVGHEQLGPHAVAADPLDRPHAVLEDGDVVAVIGCGLAIGDVAEVLEPDLACLGEGVGVGLGEVDPLVALEVVRPVAPLGVVGVQRGLAVDGVDSGDIEPDLVLDEEVPI